MQMQASMAAKQFVALYSACAAVQCIYDADVPFSRWKKLLYNASFNTIATVLRTDTSRMRASEHMIDELVRPVMLEIVATAKAAAGVELPLALVERVITADLYESFFKPSMCQDLERGNLLEFENIVGEPLREAEKAGVKTPTLRTVYALLKAMQFLVKEKKGLVAIPPCTDPGMRYGDKKEQW